MNRDDVICLIEMLDRYRPDYAAWRRDQAFELAATHGSDAATEAERMLDSACRTLAAIDAVEAMDVLERIESGSLPLPATARGYVQWERLIESLRSQVLEDRRLRRDAQRHDRENEPRYHCLDCLDMGSVLVYYPKFVEWLRPTFEEYQRSTFPAGWFTAACRQWYRRCMAGSEKAPAMLPLGCKCSCRSAKTFQDQARRFAESMRAGGVPTKAAFVGVWNPDRQCRSTGEPEKDLAAWYASHRPNETYEWQPDPLQYAGADEFGDEG